MVSLVLPCTWSPPTTQVRSRLKLPERLCVVYIFTFLSSVVCRLYKLTLSHQSQATLQLSPSSLVYRFLSRFAFVWGPKTCLTASRNRSRWCGAQKPATVFVGNHLEWLHVLYQTTTDKIMYYMVRYKYAFRLYIISLNLAKHEFLCLTDVFIYSVRAKVAQKRNEDIRGVVNRGNCSSSISGVSGCWLKTGGLLPRQ